MIRNFFDLEIPHCFNIKLTTPRAACVVKCRQGYYASTGHQAHLVLRRFVPFESNSQRRGDAPSATDFKQHSIGTATIVVPNLLVSAAE